MRALPLQKTQKIRILGKKKTPEKAQVFDGGSSGVRTLDTLIKSQVLCQLS